VAQSGYSVAGFALEQAIPETEALREYTIAKYGKPKETYVLGHSMGGELTMMSMEMYPNRYDGALPLCGLLEPTTWAIGKCRSSTGRLRLLLPRPVAWPGRHPSRRGVLDQAHGRKGAQGPALQSQRHGGTDGPGPLTRQQEDLADGAVFGTFIDCATSSRSSAPRSWTITTSFTPAARTTTRSTTA
jgi:pimeloyl-ACP methyl ester carboxylesterase